MVCLIGDVIKKKRKEAGISQVELANFLFVSQQNVSQYENGIREPSISCLVKLSEKFNCTIDELVKGE